MEITYIGHSCFRIRGREATVVTDPFPPSYGYSMGRVTATIVTISHPHPHHSYRDGVTGPPKVVDGPGEYELSDVLINGVQTQHRQDAANPRLFNTAYVIDFDDVRVCHLGDLGTTLSNAQLEALGTVNVLLVPVGGGATIGPSEAAEVVNQIEASIVVPMHFRVDRTQSGALEPVDRFLREMGSKTVNTEPKLSVTKSSLPSEPQVVVLENKKLS